METQIQLITIGKAASLLGVHPGTLRNWEKSGKITVYRTPGNHRRFSLDELQRFVDSLQQGDQNDKIVPNV